MRLIKLKYCNKELECECGSKVFKQTNLVYSSNLYIVATTTCNKCDKVVTERTLPREAFEYDISKHELSDTLGSSLSGLNTDILQSLNFNVPNNVMSRIKFLLMESFSAEKQN